jgi:hypothetical protein
LILSAKRVLERIDSAGYRLDRFLKTGAIAGLVIWFSVYAFAQPGIAPKVVSVVTLIAAVPLVVVVWRGIGRFYELEDK